MYMDQHGASGNNNSNFNMIAPFVLKTYEMVSDPSTDHLISWGRSNNSFVVMEPLDFSQRVLSYYFKHNNFSSFVRQLNTYGFRKVDPDNWEFANEWFLRGQKQLLRSISRRKHTTRPFFQCNNKLQELDELSLVVEIQRLRVEQKALDEEVKRMNLRLEATERRPQQVTDFLSIVGDHPNIWPCAIMERGRALHVCAEGPTNPEKRRRILTIGITRPDISEEEDGANSSSISSPDTCSSPNFGTYEQYIWDNGGTLVPLPLVWTPSPNSLQADSNNDVQITGQSPNYMPFSRDDDSSFFPFSLLGGGV